MSDVEAPAERKGRGRPAKAPEPKVKQRAVFLNITTKIHVNTLSAWVYCISEKSIFSN